MGETRGGVWGGGGWIDSARSAPPSSASRSPRPDGHRRLELDGRAAARPPAEEDELAVEVHGGVAVRGLQEHAVAHPDLRTALSAALGQAGALQDPVLVAAAAVRDALHGPAVAGSRRGRRGLLLRVAEPVAPDRGRAGELVHLKRESRQAPA